MMKISADLHTHTLASGHAYSTLGENLAAARDAGLQWLGMSDHAPALEGAPGKCFFQNLRVIRREWDGLQVLRGVELNILDADGSVDLPADVLAGLDYAIASLHYPVFPQSKLHRCTEAAIAAMENPAVFILGHPDDSLMPLDYPALVLAAKRHHVALEVNNSSLRPTSFRENAAENCRKMLALAKTLEAPVIVSSDSHISCDIGEVSLALGVLEELAFPEELVVNSSPKRLLDFFALRKQAAADIAGARRLSIG